MSKQTAIIKNYLKAPYTRIVIPHEAGGYVAELFEFDGCYADGDTAAQALRNLERNAADWIEERLESNSPIPEPTGGAPMNMSGRFALRLPKSLHYKAAFYAEREGVSLNTFIVDSLSGSVGILDFIDRYAKPRMETFIFNQLNVTFEYKGTFKTIQGPDTMTAVPWLKTARTLALTD